MTPRLRLLGVDIEQAGGLVTLALPDGRRGDGNSGRSWRVSQRHRRSGDDRRGPVACLGGRVRPGERARAVQTDQRVTITLSAYPDQAFEGA